MRHQLAARKPFVVNEVKISLKKGIPVKMAWPKTAMATTPPPTETKECPDLGPGLLSEDASLWSSTKGGHGHHPSAHPCRRHGVRDLEVPRQGHLHGLYLVRAHSLLPMIWRTNTKR